jgi:hypothetical protein
MKIIGPVVVVVMALALVGCGSGKLPGPPVPNINGATHSVLINCARQQCTAIPGAGPHGGTCGRVVSNEQWCVWGSGPPQQPPPAPAPTPGLMQASCVMGWDLTFPAGFTTTPPSIPGNVAFGQLNSSNYDAGPDGTYYQGAPWLYPSWSAFLTSMEAAEVTLTNPPDGQMAPTDSAVVVYYDASGTELQSGTVTISNTELMPGQSSSAEDSAPQGAATCQVVSWS